jgi:5-methylcytosine-specific restriction endonuclease McrA
MTKEERKQYHKEYAQKNRNKLNSYWRTYHTKQRAEKSFRYWAQRRLKSHRHCGYETKLSITELTKFAENAQVCAICERPLDWFGTKRLGGLSPTLDRTNNENILTLNNIQIICFECNVTKGKRTMREFVNYCHMIASMFPNNP